MLRHFATQGSAGVGRGVGASVGLGVGRNVNPAVVVLVVVFDVVVVGLVVVFDVVVVGLVVVVVFVVGGVGAGVGAVSLRYGSHTCWSRPQLILLHRPPGRLTVLL